jgi:hypothetical protein
MGPERSDPLLQSRIAGAGYLHLWRTVQVEAALALSARDQSGPL